MEGDSWWRSTDLREREKEGEGGNNNWFLGRMAVGWGSMTIQLTGMTQMEPKPQTSCVDASKQRSGYRQCIIQEVPSLAPRLLWFSSVSFIVPINCLFSVLENLFMSHVILLMHCARRCHPSEVLSAQSERAGPNSCLWGFCESGGLAGTRLGKRTTLVKTVRTFQTKHLWSMVNWQLNPEPSNTVSVSQWDAKTGEEKPNSCVLGLFLIYLPYGTTFLKHFWEIQTDVVGLIYIKIWDMSCGYSVFTVASIRCKCVGHMLSMLSQTQELCTTFNFILYLTAMWQNCCFIYIFGSRY